MAKNHLSRHHRKPRSLGGGNVMEDRNLFNCGCEKNIKRGIH